MSWHSQWRSLCQFLTSQTPCWWHQEPYSVLWSSSPACNHATRTQGNCVIYRLHSLINFQWQHGLVFLTALPCGLSYVIDYFRVMWPCPRQSLAVVSAEMWLLELTWKTRLERLPFVLEGDAVGMWAKWEDRLECQVKWPTVPQEKNFTPGKQTRVKVTDRCVC